MITLDEAIEEFIDISKDYRYIEAAKNGNDSASKTLEMSRQVADWLQELKELKCIK